MDEPSEVRIVVVRDPTTGLGAPRAIDPETNQVAWPTEAIPEQGRNTAVAEEYVQVVKRTAPNGSVSYEIEHDTGEHVRVGFTAANTLRLYTPSRRLSPKPKVFVVGRWGTSLELVNREE
jgi:hypothetical protein